MVLIDKIICWFLSSTISMGNTKPAKTSAEGQTGIGSCADEIKTPNTTMLSSPQSITAAKKTQSWKGGDFLLKSRRRRPKPPHTFVLLCITEHPAHDNCIWIAWRNIADNIITMAMGLFIPIGNDKYNLLKQNVKCCTVSIFWALNFNLSFSDTKRWLHNCWDVPFQRAPCRHWINHEDGTVRFGRAPPLFLQLYLSCKCYPTHTLPLMSYCSFSSPPP